MPPLLRAPRWVGHHQSAQLTQRTWIKRGKKICSFFSWLAGGAVRHFASCCHCLRFVVCTGLLFTGRSSGNSTEPGHRLSILFLPHPQREGNWMVGQSRETENSRSNLIAKFGRSSLPASYRFSQLLWFWKIDWISEASNFLEYEVGRCVMNHEPRNFELELVGELSNPAPYLWFQGKLSTSFRYHTALLGRGKKIFSSRSSV
ncbi:hypothetical protein QBC44DRAFT_324363 [Cladorrhinum sp. PSN332]|nr:hypothetical protein QBC44DRAFT_324363 [Cladorrhinum sp. PSN332]